VSTRMYRCSLCGYEEAETLITRSRWTSVEASGETRDICLQCKDAGPDWRRRVAEAETEPEPGERTGLLGALTRG
jgi:hypothetical protein